MHQNHENYDKPEEFRPERFLENRFGMKHDPEEKGMPWRKLVYTFGAGRRACAGEQSAVEALRILFVVLLWRYEIVKRRRLISVWRRGFRMVWLLRRRKFRVGFVSRRG